MPWWRLVLSPGSRGSMSTKVNYTAISWIKSNAVEKTIYITCHFCSCAARVALVKCRDLHWAMMAHRDQRDTSLASLRMLVVADGANPCEYLTATNLQNLVTQIRCNMLNLLSSRVSVFLWCLPERVSVPWAETWGYLSLCNLPWGHDSSYTQVCHWPVWS